ncbi:hypothetical protein ACO22_04616 [Paracoccidioides brasiliensis]|uniref:Uncharacterized protein n=1 Tax=Paracoccidioides brasiliensis TaxID=121759 RepID=A0A1D2JCJ5_PARBR|nr:hypothetical protein ACO22_04616 [Paracoccidioides brasiliensis]
MLNFSSPPVCLLGANNLVLAYLVRLGGGNNSESRSYFQLILSGSLKGNAISNEVICANNDVRPICLRKNNPEDTRVGPVATTGSSAAPRFNEHMLTPCCGSQGEAKGNAQTLPRGEGFSRFAGSILNQPPDNTYSWGPYPLFLGAEVRGIP